MQTVIDRIRSAGKDEIAEILRAGVARYQQLYPDWQISMITLQKAKDKNAQWTG